MSGAFYISKMSVVCDDGKYSEVIFNDGCNMICGPSNTGKSLIISCIDFALGSKEFHYSDIVDFNIISITIEFTLSNGDCIIIKRNVEENTKVVIKCSESDEKTLSLRKYRDFLLELIGIKGEHQVIQNQDYKKQSLSFRSMIDLSIVSENRIIGQESIFQSQIAAAQTALLSSILFLVSGEDQDDIKQKNKKTQREQKAAIDVYIKNLSSKIETIYDDSFDITDTENRIVALKSLIEEFRSRLNVLNTEIIKLQSENTELEEALYQCEYRLDRYKELNDDYMTDLQRADFIIEGDSKVDSHHELMVCPLCSSRIEKHIYRKYAGMAGKEKEDIEANIKDLEKVIYELVEEISKLKNNIFEKNRKIEELNTRYTSESSELSTIFDELNECYRQSSQYYAVKQVHDKMLSAIPEEYDKDVQHYKVKNEMRDIFITPYKKYLADMMSQCNYIGYISTDFDEGKFDIIVNGQSKESQGKGYRAYLNSVVAFSYLRFMAEKAKSHIPFLILDSPLLSLKESTEEKDNTSEPMKKGLLKYIIEHQSVGQIIIVENDLPEMDYQNVNIIEFTGSDSTGRKGFVQ